MQVSDEIVPVVLRKGHKRTAHHDKLDLIDAVTQLLQLQGDRKTASVRDARFAGVGD